MSLNYGKAFEDRFKQDFLKIPNSTVDRLYDTMNYYKSISQVSDFIGFVKPYIFYLECKTHKGASIPFENITQYKKLLSKVGIPGVRAGVILWLYEKDIIMYIPVSTISKMKADGKKSVGLKALDDGYNIKIIPSEKLKIFCRGDYSILLNLQDGE